MSTTYGELIQQHHNSCWILYSGQLVEIRESIYEQTDRHGIIIECTCPDFGLGSDKWLVLIEGELLVIESFCLWPVEEI